MSQPKERSGSKRTFHVKPKIRKKNNVPGKSKSKTISLFYWILPFLVPIFALIAIVIHKNNIRLYFSMAREDHVVEWVTFTFLFVSGLLSLILAAYLKKKSDQYALFFLLFGVGCILFSAEEISWGQRIFGYESSEFFLERSDQREINIHNVLQKEFHFKTKHVTGWVLILYGSCLPFLCLIERIKKITTHLRLKVPPLSLSPSFFIGSTFMIDKPTGIEEEYGELLLSLCLLIFIGLEYYIEKKTKRPFIK